MSDNRITDEQIAKRVHFEGAIPRIIVGAGPSRSGTTLIARIFAEQNIPTWYQPLKAIVRGYLNNNDIHLTVPDVPLIFIKETFGAYVNEEAVFNPISALMKCGVPSEKIHFLALAREPFATASSFVEHFSTFDKKEDLIEGFIKSYMNLAEICRYCLEHNIQTTHLVYEIWRMYNTSVVTSRLFSRLHTPFDSLKTTEWKLLESLKEIPNMHWLPEPESYYSHTDFFLKVKQTPGIGFSDRTSDSVKQFLSEGQISQLHQSKAENIYSWIRSMAISDLALQPDTANAL